MNTSIHVHSLQLDFAQRHQLKQAYEALHRSIESTGSLYAALFDQLISLMRSALESQPGLPELLKDAEFNKRLLHLCDANTDLLNLPWRLATDHLPLLCLSKGIANGKGILPVFTPEITPPLKILVMISAPEDTHFAYRLDYEAEEASIIAAFKTLYESANVEIHFTEDGSLESLERALRDNDYHALHFSGHGTYQNGQGYLQLEDPVTNRSSLATADQFAQSLKAGNTAPALVMLSSCQTAQGMVQGTEFLGVANRLLQANIPGVIAMGFSIRDDYATLFAAGFYEALSKRKNVWEAFHLAVVAMREAEGKAQMQSGRQPHPAQWMIPQLYCSHACEQLTDWSLAKKGLTFSAFKFVAGEQRLLLEQQPGYLFIGRRRERREAFARLLERKPVHLKGAGGVGKTALSEHLVQRLIVRKPDERREIYPFVFNETTTNLQGILNAFQKYLQGEKRQWLIRSETEKFEKNTDKLMFLLGKLDEVCIPVFVFDNLESFQDGKGGGFKGEYAELAETLHFLCETQAYHLLLTGRYPLDFPNLGEAVNLNTVSFGDFWQKSFQLSISELRNMLGEHERISVSQNPVSAGAMPTFYDVLQLLYCTFGGNYRALEFFDTLYQERKVEIFEVIGRLGDLEKRILEKEKGDVLAKLQEGAKSLVFDELLTLAGDSRLQVLQLLAPFRIPVPDFAVEMQFPNIKSEKKSKEILSNLNRLVGLTIVEKHQLRFDENNALDFYYVPPIAKDLLAKTAFKEGKRIHFSDILAGEYYRYSRDITELKEGFFHFSRVGAKEQINQVGGRLCDLLYGESAFHAAFFYAKETEKLVGEEMSGNILNILGLLYQLFGNLDKALFYHEKELEEARYEKNTDSEGTILNNISQIHYAKGNYDEAMQCLEQSLKIRHTIRDLHGESVTLNNIGLIHMSKGNHENALYYLEKSLEIARGIGDLEQEATAVNNISKIYKDKSDDDEAVRYLEQSLKISQTIGDRKGECVTLNNLATITMAKGFYSNALHFLEQSLEIAQEIGYLEQEATILNNISQIHKSKDDYDEALQYLEKSLTISQAIGHQKGEAASLVNIWVIYKAKGDYNNALYYLKQSLKIFQALGDQREESTALSNIGQMYQEKGDFENALQFFKQSLIIIKAIGDLKQEDVLLDKISHIYIKQEDYNSALSYLEQSLIVTQTFGNQEQEAITMNTIGHVLINNGDLDMALKYLEESLKISHAIGDKKTESAALYNIGGIYQDKGLYDSALQHLEECLKICQVISDWQVEDAALSSISQIHRIKGDLDSALEYLEQSLKIGQEINDINGVAYTMTNMGAILFEQGRLEEAVPLLVQAYNIFEQIDSSDAQAPESFLNIIVERIGQEQFDQILAAT